MRKKNVQDNMSNIELLSVYVDLRTKEKKYDKDNKTYYYEKTEMPLLSK
jgi:hypothetical protein